MVPVTSSSSWSRNKAAFCEGSDFSTALVANLETEDFFIQPTKAVLAVDSSLPREGILENLLIWSRNRQNNIVTFHSKVMIENFRNIKGGTTHPVVMKSAEKVLPDNMGNGSAKHVTGLYRLEVVVADDTAHIVVVMFNDTTTELIKCSAESLMVADDEGADADADSNLPTSIRNLIGTTHILEIKSHTYYKYDSFYNIS
nr:hypothetical protein [Tanacetum cinerariifolium]